MRVDVLCDFENTLLDYGNIFYPVVDYELLGGGKFGFFPGVGKKFIIVCARMGMRTRDGERRGVSGKAGILGWW